MPWVSGRSPVPVIASLMLAAPSALLCLVGVGSYSPSSPWQAVGALSSLFLPVAVLVLLVAVSSVARTVPSDAREAGSTLAAGAWAGALAGVVGVAQLLVHDPYLDPFCDQVCTPSALTVWRATGLATGLANTRAILLVVGFGLLGVATGLRARRADGPGHASGLLLLCGAGCHAAAAATLLGPGAAASWLEPRRLTAALSISGLLAIALALAVVLVPRMVTRLRVRSVLKAIERSGEADWQQALRRLLSDPELDVAYLVEPVGLVASDGATYVPPAGSAITTLEWRGHVVAVVVHSVSSVTVDMLAAQLGPKAMILIENESLRLQLDMAVRSLHESRHRIVAVADATRRQVERDLHDGAQQRLLAITFDLQRASRAAMTAGDAATARAIDEAELATAAVLAALRSFAVQVRPPALDVLGVGPALLTRAEALGRSAEVSGQAVRAPHEVELAAYAILEEALLKTSNDLARISLVRKEETLICRFVGGKVGDYAHDRATVLRGSISYDDDVLVVELPCAS